MQKNIIRVRFAPSPTGYLHIGSARTALFNWLYARRQGGCFVLRIEDTDKQRSEKKYLTEILSSLKWLGIEAEEGPYLQSERLEVYQSYADILLHKGLAYQDNGAIRLKIAKEVVVINDLIHGQMKFDNSLTEDLVIIKSDKTPTYNFACVVDDATMGITHIIRGDDHISNTPKQVAVYNALEFKAPVFAHIPLIMGEEGTRLSKRFGATSVAEYKKMGYLPEALFNYLCLLGWSPGGNKEIFSTEEAIKKFSIKKINKTAAIFDIKKLNWINSEYIKKYPLDKLTDLILPYIVETVDKEYLKKLVKLYQTRIKRLKDFVIQADFFFKSDIEYSEDAINKLGEDKNIVNLLSQLKDVLNALVEKSTQNVISAKAGVHNLGFSAQQIEKQLRILAEKNKVKAAVIIHAVRAALTGKTVSPGLFEVMSLLGKKKVIDRLDKAIKLIS